MQTDKLRRCSGACVKHRNYWNRRSPRRTPLQLLHGSVAALAPPKLLDRGKKVFPGKIGPQLWRDVQLSVRRLPQQEVRQAHFAGSTNQQIRVGIVASVKMFAEHLYIDHCLVDVTQLNRAEQTFNPIHDFKPAAVAQRKDKRETCVCGSLLDRFVKTLYNDSPASLMMQLLGQKKTSKKELQAIKDMIKKLDRDAK